MRLFIAIDLEELKDELDIVKDEIDDSLGKINKVSTYHLTLKFLGDVEEVDSVKEKLNEIEFEKFSLTLDKVGVFPNENYIKVIWVGVKPWDKVKELQSKVEDVLKEFNFKKDFEFHPHITLARVRFLKNKSKFVDGLYKISIDEKELVVKDFRLVKSTLTPDGPVYEDVVCFNSL